MRTPSLVEALAGCASLLVVGVAAVGSCIVVMVPPDLEPEQISVTGRATEAPMWRGAIESGRSLAREFVAVEKLPGLSLAVAVDGEIVWTEGYRFADLATETPVTPRTRFRIGGVTQALTSTAVGLLVDRGVLDLDESIVSYLPQLEGVAGDATLRDLMAHSAGLRPLRGEGGLFQGRTCRNDAERLAPLLAEPPWKPAGTEVRFSTLGWSVVAAVVHEVVGEPLVDYLEREVLSPLGAEGTGPDSERWGEPGSGSSASTATFYYPRLMLNPPWGLQDAPAVDLSCHLHSVGFLATPADLVRVGSALLRGELLSSQTFDELTTPITLANGEMTDQALGWNVGVLDVTVGSADRQRVPVVGQGLGAAARRGLVGAETAAGQVSGGTATLLLIPDHGVAVAVASNVTGADNVAVLAGRLAEGFLTSAGSLVGAGAPSAD